MEKTIEQAVREVTGATDAEQFAQMNETAYKVAEKVYELACLERQKENPKNADSIPADCASSAKCENEHNKSGDFVFELRQIISRHRYADLYGECVDDEEGMAREIMALCERQKHAGWSEEDEAAHTRILGAIAKAFMGVLPTKPSEEDVHWLKTLPERFNLQPKQEWSEEDRLKINRIYEILGNAADDKGFLTSKRIIGDKEAIELQDFLKSLRHSWKPSEEVLAELTRIKDSMPNNEWGNQAEGVLDELIENLKKL